MTDDRSARPITTGKRKLEMRALIAALLLAIPTTVQARNESASRTSAAVQAAPIHQLRIYELNSEKRDVFHARFRDHALRIMKRHGFNVVAMWETASPKGPEFAYLLEWPNEDAMRTAWQAFLRDREWSDIKAATRARDGSIMGAIQDRVMRATSYSPTLK